MSCAQMSLRPSVLTPKCLAPKCLRPNVSRPNVVDCRQSFSKLRYRVIHGSVLEFEKLRDFGFHIYEVNIVGNTLSITIAKLCMNFVFETFIAILQIKRLNNPVCEAQKRKTTSIEQINSFVTLGCRQKHHKSLQTAIKQHQFTFDS